MAKSCWIEGIRISANLALSGPSAIAPKDIKAAYLFFQFSLVMFGGTKATTGYTISFLRIKETLTRRHPQAIFTPHSSSASSSSSIWTLEIPCKSSLTRYSLYAWIKLWMGAYLASKASSTSARVVQNSIPCDPTRGSSYKAAFSVNSAIFWMY